MVEEPQGQGVETSSQLRLLPHVLTNTAQPRALYVLKAWLLSLVGCIPLGLAVSGLSDTPPTPEFPASAPMMIFAVVIFAPVVETLLMVPPVLLLSRSFGPLVGIAGSALLWGALHSLAEPGWGLVIWWPFAIFSTTFVVWEHKGVWKAMAMVMAVHALQNSVPALSLLLAG